MKPVILMIPEKTEELHVSCKCEKEVLHQFFDEKEIKKVLLEKTEEMTESVQGKIEYIANHYGIVSQSNIAIEEMSELTKALCKIRRYPAMDPRVSKYLDNAIEEIADVLIMGMQLRYLYGAAEVDRVIKAKIDRQIREIELK